MSTRQCKGTTRKGSACKAAPLTGSDYCLSHSDADTRASVGFTPEAGHLGGRPRLPRPTEVARQLVEAHITAVLHPYFKALGLELHDDGTVTECEGAVRYQWTGFDSPAEKLEDLGGRMLAAERLLDRIYGKPRQQTEVTGAGGGPVQVEGVDLRGLDPEDLEQLERILSRAAAGAAESG